MQCEILNFDDMRTKNYLSALVSSSERYHRAQRGGNKRMIDYLEQNNYSNDSLLACCKVKRDNNNKLNKHIMATKNLLTITKKRCPHMGCALKWNELEHSWDCPCHGSRFDEKGRLLDNPANGNLDLS